MQGRGRVGFQSTLPHQSKPGQLPASSPMSWGPEVAMHHGPSFRLAQSGIGSFWLGQRDEGQNQLFCRLVLLGPPMHSQLFGYFSCMLILWEQQFPKMSGFFCFVFPKRRGHCYWPIHEIKNDTHLWVSTSISYPGIYTMETSLAIILNAGELTDQEHILLCTNYMFVVMKVDRLHNKCDMCASHTSQGLKKKTPNKPQPLLIQHDGLICCILSPCFLPQHFLRLFQHLH